ncbi:MAG: hypothetical protein HYT80_03935, partial [Euryarchaeota archaeon]|nr:hypothetical protein [Euryarchaeota archaeon]
MAGVEGLKPPDHRPSLLERVFSGTAKLVIRRPRIIIAAFLVGALLFLPAIGNLQLYMSFYQLIPEERREGDAYTKNYFEDYQDLNTDYGGDNWDYYLFQLNGTQHQSMTEVRPVREMNAIAERLKGFPYVEGTLSLAELVKIANQLVTGRYEFPPDTADGDEQVRQALDFLLCKGAFTPPAGQRCPHGYRDQIYGNILTPDERTSLMVIILRKGEPLENYRDYAKELKEFGFDIDEHNPYQDAIKVYPFNLETIYLKLDETTLSEGVWWIAGTLV